VEFSYKQEGLVFYHHGLSINYILLVILSPIIIYTYVRQGLKLRNHYANYYELELYLTETKKINLTGFLDTGNKLYDPYFHKPVILVNKDYLSYDIDNLKTILIPYYTVNNNGLLKCVIPYKLIIKGIGVKTDFLVGIINDETDLDGVTCILHTQLLEG
ncbi:MAG: sigma-E processing peptidase SpoIIGA, partial [Bacilli bacterium]|nr:sigma-E processing peptidase SpoIIGA [Bacilli bacterium]